MKPVKNLLMTFGLLIVVLSSTQALAQIAFVKTIGTVVYNTEGAQIMTWAPASGVAAGNSIIISLALNPGSTLIACFDIKGNTYSVDYDVVQGSGTSGVRTIVLSAHNVIPLVQYDVIVCQHQASAVRAMSVNEFSGLAATAAVDKTASSVGNSNAPTSSSTSTTTQVKELLFGAIGVEAGVSESFTAGAGYTTIGRAGTTKSVATDNVTINPEYQIVNSVGTYAATGTLSTSRNWAAAIVTYNAAPPSAPFISSLSPTSGRKNSLVTINGSGFGAAQGASAVSFNGVAATPTSWSNSQIITPVPMEATTGPIVVTVGGVVSNGVTFTVIIPMIVQLNVPWKPQAQLSPQERIAQGEAIVAAQDQLLAQLAGTEYTLLRRLSYTATLGLYVGPDALAVLENSNLVRTVIEDIPMPPLLLQTVLGVGASQAWTAGFDGTGSAIAILDTGVDKDHPFLSGSVIAEACFSLHSNCPNGSTEMIGPGAGVPCTYANNGCTHGTHVAGIVAGRGAGISGVAKGASLIAIQITSRFTGLDCVRAKATEDPCALSQVLDQVTALEYVHYLHLQDIISADVVNISFGEGEFSDQAKCDKVYDSTKVQIDDLRGSGIATVIASGNEGFTNAINAPACISSAISVGATTKSDGVWPSSNSAPFLSLVAPGVSICSSIPTGTTTPIQDCFSEPYFESGDGTSLAAPHVAAAWAILKQKKPDATVGQILNALQTTGTTIEDIRTGSPGRLNCRIQIDEALNNIPQVFTTFSIPESFAFGINNCGKIVGAEYVGHSSFITDTKGTYIPVVYDGPIEEGGFYYSTEARSIDNRGTVHGHYCCGLWGDLGFVRSPNGSIATVSDPYTNVIRGNNDLGDFVGAYFYNPPLAANLKFVGGTTTLLEDIAPVDINNMRRIVGSGGSSGELGVLVDEMGTHEFYPSGSQWTIAFSVNEANYIVGCYLDASSTWHGFLREPNRTLSVIDVPGASHTCTYGINDSSQIVGYYRDASGADHAFLDLKR